MRDNTEQEANTEEVTNGVEPDQDQSEQEAPARDLAAEYLEALQRERASFINYKRRVEQEKADTAQYAASNLLKKLLPVMDDFDRALASIPEVEREGHKWLQGIELIARKLHTVMDGEGIEPIEALGQPFDPNLHEAVAFEDNSAEGEHADTVSEVFAKGYKLKDRVLRPAMVKVSRG
ncbi:MAG: nucleotide exchange factor GrpE [Chloroflexia bacterium]